MAQRFKVALFGLGKMGRNHLRVMREHGGFEVVALVDPRPETSALLPEGAKWFASVEGFLAAGLAMDAGVVASSTKTHFAISDKLLALRKPLLVEKPLAHTSQAAEQLANMARDAGVAVFVAHTERSNPGVRKLKEVIESGIIGMPIHFSTTRVGGMPGESERKETNVLLDLAVHDLDVLSVLAGDFNLRSSICHSTLDRAFPDTAHLLLTGVSGCSASVHVNWITPTKIRTVHVTGSLGVAQVDYIMQTCRVIGGNMIKRRERTEFNYQDVVADYLNSDTIEFGVTRKEPLMVQIGEFHRYLTHGECSLSTAVEAAKTVHLAEMAITFGQGGVAISRKAG